MGKFKYRPDIDGLRAVAVISVIIFHLDESYLSGGYLGVDIFFVISGYLITGIIYREFIENRFSLSNFYTRRAKRILPPLFSVLLMVMIVGYFVMLPYEYYKVGVSIISVLLFISNVQYSLRIGDYFSGESSEWPLLHTWSLSVEEQYYFIFPLTLFVLIKFFNSRKTVFLFAIALMSFLLAEVLSGNDKFQSISFYLIFTRMGELLIGSVLAVLAQDNKIKPITSSFISVLSLVIIGLMLITINETYTTPGLLSLLLCVCVVIIINSHNTLVNKWLSNRVMVSIGLVSYSLYLYHWPIMAYYRYLYNLKVKILDIPVISQFSIVLLTFILSVASYFLIERPLRRNSLKGKKVALFYFILPSLIMGGLSSFVYLSNGYPTRLDINNILAKKQYNHIDKEKCPSLVNEGCKGGNIGSKKSIFLFGNSHAEHYFEYVSLLANDHGYEVQLYASGGCGLMPVSSKCKHIQDSFNKVKDSADIIVISYRWDALYKKTGFDNDLQKIIRGVKSNNNRVIVMAQPPLLKFSPTKLQNCSRLGLNCIVDEYYSDQYPDYNKVVEKVTTLSGVEFFDPYTYVKHPKTIEEKGKLYFSDNDHLSVYGGDWLYSQYQKKNDIFR
ncbi:acyltransferase [Vibrio sp. JC009]|uniref:acyltransferase family protein n=1 Tax=Vibrio sp. JC009 TaxID=2912314 RepID=UPI0023AF8837|nr:acyltransferase family protein [Vibrio sp. JC009]WED20618.1 acyltransferase [Vibrio sp. JC009]